jgi:hypothetical protein
MWSTTSNDNLRSIRSEYPYIVEKLSSITITLHNNLKLAATIWMPKSLIISNKCLFLKGFLFI